MKFSTVFVALAAAAATVSAMPSESNAQRLARGLPPLPPVRRGSEVEFAKRTHPSSTPPHCGTGPVQCCHSLEIINVALAGIIKGLLGIDIGLGVKVGLNCSPLSLIGIGSGTCTHQTVCCSDNSYNGAVAIGCSPVSL